MDYIRSLGTTFKGILLYKDVYQFPLRLGGSNRDKNEVLVKLP